VDAYDKLIRYCRSEINIALLGQDQTTEANTNHASATAGLEVTDDIRDSDSRIVMGAINQLIDWICELNFGDVARPKFVLYEAEAYGSTELSQRDLNLHQMGARFSNDYFARAYGFKDGDLLPERQPENANFAEHHHHEYNQAADVPQIMETAVSGSLKTNPPDVTGELVGSLKNGATPEAVLQQLADSYPDWDDAAMQNELARLIFLADVVGRLEAQAELAEG
jgi:hypothetical protein